MYLMQIWNQRPYSMNPNSYKFEMVTTNWAKDYLNIHSIIGIYEK